MNDELFKEYEDALEILSSACMFKLKLNSHKGDISDLFDDELLLMANNEIRELDEELQKPDKCVKSTIMEAADVTNFLLAIVIKQIRKEKSKNAS